MRTQLGLLILALIAAGVLYVVSVLVAFVDAAPLDLKLPIAVPLVLKLPIFVRIFFAIFTYMAQNAMTVQEIVKQVAVWFGIVALLPLAVWYGTSVYSASPDWKKFSKEQLRIEEKILEAKDRAEKEKLRQEKDRLEEEREEAELV